MRGRRLPRLAGGRAFPICLDERRPKMNFSKGRWAAVRLAGLAMVCLATGRVSTAPYALPNPVLVLKGQEFYQTGGKSFLRYNYAVDNSAAYPADLFAAAPQLPPCGNNTKA